MPEASICQITSHRVSELQEIRDLGDSPNGVSASLHVALPTEMGPLAFMGQKITVTICSSFYYTFRCGSSKASPTRLPHLPFATGNTAEPRQLNQDTHHHGTDKMVTW